MRLEFDGEWSVQQLSEFLGALRVTYACVLDFERSHETEGSFRPPRHRYYDFPGPVMVVDPAGLQSEPTKLPQDVTAVLALDGEPQLVSIHIASPGWAEVFGKVNPLAVIVDFIKWLKNQDLRRQKLAADITHQTLENHLLANEVIRQRVDLLRGMGYPKRKIQALLAEQIARPLESLRPFIETKSINGSVRALPAPKTESKESAAEEDAPVDEDDAPVNETKG